MKERKSGRGTLTVQVNFQRDGACAAVVNMQCTPSFRVTTSHDSMPFLLQFAARAAEAVHDSQGLEHTCKLQEQLDSLAFDAHRTKWPRRAVSTVSVTPNCQISGHTWRPSSAVISSGSLVLLHRDRPMNLQLPALHARLQATDAGPDTEVFVTAVPTQSGQVWMRTFIGKPDQCMQAIMTNQCVGKHIPSTMSYNDLHAVTREVHGHAVRSLLGIHANLGPEIKSSFSFCKPFLVHHTCLPCQTQKNFADVVTVLRSC